MLIVSKGAIDMEDSKLRRLSSLESLINHSSTGENEKNVAIGRWEAISGQKWTGKSYQQGNPSGGRRTASTSSNTKDWDDFADAFRRSGFGGFNGFSGGFGFDDDVDADSFAGFAGAARQRADRNARQYDYSKNYCTQKQYDYVKAISDFFRWKCPVREDIEFEEAQDFLNRYSDIFKMFYANTRNFSNLKRVFEALGVNWSQTCRTFKWKAFHER